MAADGIGMITVAFGFIAIASSIFMSISPVPFFWRILKNKSTEEYHPHPFRASFISNFMWLSYCFWDENDRFVTACLSVSCGTGIVFDVFYIAIYIGCSTNQGTHIIMQCIIFAGCFSFPLGFLPLSRHLDEPARKVFLGTLGVLSGILMYLSPLSNIIHVYKTKSSKYMPFVRCISMFPNSICWFIFSCMKETFDWYLVITNGLGILLGLIPLSILYKFYESPPIVKRLEATLDVDPREEIMVHRVCPRCKDIMFEHKKKIKFNPVTKYMLYQIDGSKSWQVNAAENKTLDVLETYKGVSDRFDKLLRGRGKNPTQVSYHTHGADQV